MKAAIVTIGDEILIGQVIDTNSAFICCELNQTGIQVNKIISVTDSKVEIFNAIDALKEVVDIVLMTGGLGPTNDDITKHALAEYFNQQLVLNQEALEHITRLLQARKIKMNDRNRDQALLPENCRLVPNEFGTAMGMWFENKNKHYIALPGVPHEMKAMITGHVIPALIKQFKLPAIVHRTVHTTGVAESAMADRISEWESELPKNIKLAYLPSPGVLRLRLTASGNDKKSLEKQITLLVERLRKIIGTSIFGFDDTTLEAEIGVLLKQSRKTVAIAESCTGGKISHMITSVPGSSDYFKGGIIAYDNDVKINLLGVSKEMLEKSGAVSKPVVIQMAEGIRKRLNTDYAIATSGIAGPAGGTAEKPVGTVWIAVACEGKTIASVFSLGKLREINITRASVAALNMLRLTVIRNNNQTS
ncbi:MAG TPA: competence/damage-inducible protein A [Bacteroidales bacterium]|nr:competence/damage-inducible protein A [Bacteroidales bacterium]